MGWHPVAAVWLQFTHEQYIEYTELNINYNHKMWSCEVRAVPRLCELYPGICLKTEEKARKNLS